MQGNIKINSIKQKLLVILFCMSSLASIRAQDTLAYTYPKHFINIYTSNPLLVPVDIKNFGFPILQNPVTPSIGAGIGYAYKLPKNWGVTADYQYVLLRSKVNALFFSDTLFFSLNPPKDIKTIANKGHQHSMRFSILKELYLRPQFFLRFSGGFSIDFIKTENISFTYNEVFDGKIRDILIYENKSKNFNNRATSLSYFGKLGIGKKFNHGSSISVSLFAQHNPKILTYGKYNFPSQREPSQGFTKWNASNFGLELCYSISIENNKQKIGIVEPLFLK